jgi:hypothetical protein
MSKKGAKVEASSSAAPKVPLTGAELEKSWKELGALLKDQEKEDVKHAAVHSLAEKSQSAGCDADKRSAFDDDALRAFR